MKYLICGLGNPGPEYELTRHNIGFLVLDRFAEKLGVSFKSDRLGWVAEGKFKGRTFILLKPSTYMNLSGKAVNYWLQQEKIPVEQLMVITDDIALPFGKLRMRSKGSNGGHNGLGNIQQVLGTEVYPRLRFGVGGDFSKGKQVDYVLGNFAKEEMEKLPEIMDKACQGVIDFSAVGIERAMNSINTK
jgi:peptidyl-tRNA hydrolase, PTH1 family